MTKPYNTTRRTPKFLITIALIQLTLTALPLSGIRAARSTRADYRPVIEMLRRFVQHEMTDKGLSAVSIALIDDQQTVWCTGFGYADPKLKIPADSSTVYRVGSVSKLFTDIAVMQLAQDSKLDLNAPVNRYLPDFRPHNPFNRAITLRQLMSHQSGLVREPPVGNYFDPTEPSLQRTISSLNETSLVYEPETHTKYSNAAIATVGYVLERTQREPFAKYVKRAVLDPLGLTQSSFEPPQMSSSVEGASRSHLAKAYMWTLDGRTFEAPEFQLGIAPAGSLYTTVGDLAKFISVLFTGGGRVLKRPTLEQMWTPQFGEKTKFGIGFHLGNIEGHRSVGHGGAIYGFATSLEALPDDKLGVVVVTTKDSANGVTGRIAAVALKAMLSARQGKPIAEPELTLPVAPERARRLAGRYVGSTGGFDLIESNGNLSIISLDGGEQHRLRSLAPALVIDDAFEYGTRVLTRGNLIAINNRTFRRTDIPKPDPAPDQLKGLIGEYGWDHDILYILEKDGKLWALIEWFEFDPLEQVSKDVFKFPNRGLYDGEKLIFKRDRTGYATQVEAANVVFKRRKVGPESGAQQLRIRPVRPVNELLKEAVSAEPPIETGNFRPPELIEVTSLDPTIKLDIRYATTNNFLASVFYSQPRAFLQRPAAEAFVRAHKKLGQLGYGLLIHDAYRPWYVTKVFWDATPNDKKIFVADPSRGSRHNRGAAVDVTLYDLKTVRPVEMVSTYDETTDRAYPDYPGGASLQRWHRRLLRDALEAEGFTVYEAEWWHFDYKDWQSYRIGNQRFEQILRN